MDRKLSKAAEKGDVKFLQRAVEVEPREYFLGRHPYMLGIKGNIIHLAVWGGKIEFVREAIRILPNDIQKELFFQIDEGLNWTLFHLAALVANTTSYPLVKLFKEMYASLSLSEQDEEKYVKPWLELNMKGMTPLHVFLSGRKENEKCAMEMLSMDQEFESCTIVDKDDNTPLSYALKNRFDLVAEKILTSHLSSTSLFCSKDPIIPFRYAANCSENIVRLLFEKCGDRIDKIDEKGLSVLHHWADKEVTWPCKLLLDGDDFAGVRRKVFKEMIFVQEKEQSDTPLHIAARKKNPELGQILIRGYQQELSIGKGENQVECPPWKIKNIHGDTPLHCALTSKQEELALEILSVDPSVCKIRNNKGESPFFLSVLSGFEPFIAEVMRIEDPPYHLLHRTDGFTVVHILSNCPEETGKKVLEKYWWITNLRNDEGKTALECAKQADALWLVTLLSNPSLIQKQDFDWIDNCKRGESRAVLAFVDNCPDLRKVCREKNDTPLHHIHLSTDEEYLDFLKTPSIAELKNTADHDGATPLHRALERKDMHLAKVLLLDDVVARTIKDNKGTTAMDLLSKLCKKNNDWENMCKQINVNPYQRTSYIQRGTDLNQMRNNLSVVAALFATITFAAGFTLPGGINSVTGEALLAKKAAFSVFLLADAYGMCTSMFVLFCLMWSMVSKPDRAELLVDRSVFILMQSLYATLLAFMTGIYTVVADSSLWASILVFFMCSIIGISVNRTILHWVIAKFVPAADTENLEQMHLLEEGSIHQ